MEDGKRVGLLIGGIVVAVLLVIALVNGIAANNYKKKLQNEVGLKQALQQQLSECQKQSDSIKEATASIRQQLVDAEAQIQKLKEEKDGLVLQVKAKDDEIARLNVEMLKLKKIKEQMEENLGEALMKMPEAPGQANK